MPKYKFRFSRDYTISESCERIISAPTLAEAEAAASNIASEFNHDCPDDVSEDESGTQETGDFSATCTSAEVHKASDPDYVVLAHHGLGAQVLEAPKEQP